MDVAAIAASIFSLNIQASLDGRVYATGGYPSQSHVDDVLGFHGQHQGGIPRVDEHHALRHSGILAASANSEIAEEFQW